VKALLRDTRGRSKSSVAISVAVHVLAGAALMSITFHYPIEELFTRPDRPTAIPVRYIPLTPRATASPAAGAPATPTRRATPISVVPDAGSIPVGSPAPVAPTAPAAAAIGAGGTGAPSGRDPGIGFGIRPGIPDGRLANPMSIAAAPETEGQKAERALSAIYGQYLDSARAAMANRGREAGDWSWGGKDGEKWGWDKNGIHVGGITIPNVVLAALPLNIGPTGHNMNGLLEARADAYMRSDIQSHAGLMSEDEFRAAVKRVRERVDRERRERMEKANAKKTKEPPCCSNE
jgi:hypothetical protein